MASEATQPEPAQSLPFEFCRIGSSETVTLGELIRSLDAELQEVKTEPVTSRTLKRTLDFLQKSIGIGVAGNDEPLPMSTVKTLRLLFLTDLHSDRNVFRLLAPPESVDEATMEFSTATTIPRDKEAAKLIRGLTDTLALEIDPMRVQTFSRLLGTRESHSVAEKLLLHVERTNDEVSATLREGLCGDEALLTLAFGHIARLMDQFCVEKKEELNTPANEALYTYLETLAFRHFIQHHSKHLEDTRIQLDIGDIRNEAENFCRLAADNDQSHHGPASRIFSVNTSHLLLSAWPDQITGSSRTHAGSSK